MSAGRFFDSSRGGSLDAPLNALPQAGPDNRAPEGGNAAPVAGARGPDISSLSPQEQADRLFNRVMRLHSQGKTDSILFFAPMAISAYQMLSPLNADQRYDLGRIAEVAGALDLAKSQADSILRSTPNHLLGLTLAARLASLSGDSASRRQYEAKLLASESSEKQKKLPEYERHQDDISAALAGARQSAGRRQ